MFWRFISRFLMNDKVVDKLADSYPMRRAAQWVVYFMHKTKAVGSVSPVDRKVIELLSARLEASLKRIKDNLEQKVKKQ